MTGLNIIDFIIIIIFLSSVLIGFGRGFVSEVISLGTLLAAIVVAIIFAQPLATYFTSASSVQDVISQTSSAAGIDTTKSVSYLALGVSFFVLFVATAFVGTIISYVLNAAFQVALMGLGNRLLGAAFGFARGFIMNLVLIFLIQLSPFVDQPLWQNSKLVRAYQPAVQWLANIVSPTLANLKEKLGEKLQDATSGLQDYVR